jgi:acyl-CoA synthetase (AMP-forming)/AMP-acid ligase II
MPVDAGTLADRLAATALADPTRLAFRFLADGETSQEELSYGELFHRAAALAEELASTTSVGERALILCPPGVDNIVALFACFMARVIAVPAPAPHPARIAAQGERVLSQLRDCEPEHILSTTDLCARRGDFAAAAWEFATPRWIAVDHPRAGAGAAPRPARASDLALLQYTSGSTSSPKGVMLTHAAFMANQALTASVTAAGPSAHFVSWLPFHHDLGLGGFLHTIYAAVGCTFMSPFHFAQRPLRWLEAVSRFGGTTTAAPNFALERLTERVAAGAGRDLDLRRLDTIILGAEPLRPRTLADFVAALAPMGLRREAMTPCYGLAESTVHCTHSRPGAGPVVGAFDAAALRRHEVRPCPPGSSGDAVTELTGNGLPGPLHEILIVDPASGTAAPADSVGEIWFRGPSVGQGYWRRPDATEEVFGARATPDGPRYLRTGDLGFRHGDDLYVTGRLKDLIIVRGRNIHPEDVEDTVRRIAPAIGPGVAAVESARGGVLVVAELRGGASLDPSALMEQIRSAVSAQYEVEVDGVDLVAAMALPRTTSGKIRRAATREALVAGSLPSLRSWRTERRLSLAEA